MVTSNALISLEVAREPKQSVRSVTDEFLADKPEEMEFLYSGGYSRGFFRKV